MFLICSLPFDHDSSRYQALPKYVICTATHSLLRESHRSILVKFTCVLRSSSIVRSLRYLEKASARVSSPHFNMVSENSPLIMMHTEVRWCLRGDKLRITIQKGMISLPNDPQTPVICVGPGTGVAPMRAVVEDRVLAGSKGQWL